MLIRAAGAAIVLALLASACGDDAPPTTAASTTTTSTTTTSTTTTSTTTTTTAAETSTSPWPAPLSETHQRWSIDVVERHAHDPATFTQGLEFLDGDLLEGTGRRGQSTIRRVAADGTVIAQAALDDALFGEGITVVDDTIIQLTWQAGQAVVWNAESFEQVGTHVYDGEGWGICFDGATLWMSDGTATLTQRRIDDFSIISETTVRREGIAVDNINELECVGESVMANVWKSDEILVIEPSSGVVQATIDASALRGEIQPTDDQAVLNGIADRGDGTLLLGGKLWPTFFVVRLVS